MAGLHRNRFKNIDNTGYGTNSSTEGGRLVNPDGTNMTRPEIVIQVIKE